MKLTRWIFAGTLVVSMTGNVVASWGHIALMFIGAWMPLALILAEVVLRKNPHLPRALHGALVIVALACVTFSMGHLAMVATPADPTGFELFSAWLFPISVDVLMVIAGWAVMSGHKPAPAAADPEVLRLRALVAELESRPPVIVEVEAPRPAAVESETTEVTETTTRTVRRTSTRGMSPELKAQVVDLIVNTDMKAVEIMRKLEIEGHPNKITRLPEWAQYRA